MPHQWTELTQEGNTKYKRVLYCSRKYHHKKPVPGIQTKQTQKLDTKFKAPRKKIISFICCWRHRHHVLEDKRYNILVTATFFNSFHALIQSDHVHFMYISLCLDPIFRLDELVSFQCCSSSRDNLFQGPFCIQKMQKMLCHTEHHFLYIPVHQHPSKSCTLKQSLPCYRLCSNPLSPKSFCTSSEAILNRKKISLSWQGPSRFP